MASPSPPPSTTPTAFLTLPYEVRQQIYTSMLTGQHIHICPDPTRTHHTLRPSPTETPAQRTQRFNNELLTCSSNSYELLAATSSLTPSSTSSSSNDNTAKWTHVVPSPSHPSYLPDPPTLLAFLLTSRQIYTELHPLIYHHVTFAFGLPQFAAFHDRFLTPPPSTTTSPPPTTTLTSPSPPPLRNVTLAFIRETRLADRIGADTRYRQISSLGMVKLGKWEGVSRLSERCPGLREVMAVLDGEDLREGLGPGGIAVDFEDCQALLRFRGVESVRLCVGWVDEGVEKGEGEGPGVDAAGGSERGGEVEVGTAQGLSARIKAALAATGAALTAIVKRSEAEETAHDADVPPEGVSADDEDWKWLKEQYERAYEGNPRFSELILRTKVILQSKGVEVPGVLDADF